MDGRVICRAALGLFLVAVSASAGQRPDLSGTWTAETAPGTEKTPQVFGPQFAVTHQEPSLTITRTINGAKATVKYPLDGSDVASRMPGRLCEADSGATWKASWEGEKVSIAMLTAVPPNGKPIKTEVSQTLTLQSADTMRVDVTARTGAQASPRTTSTIYKRTGPPPAAAPASRAATARLGQMAWLAGVWNGAMGSSVIEERWTPSAGGSMLAVSRTIRDGVMSAFEFLCIVERDGGLVYTAMPNGRQPATDFTLTKIDETSATFENPEHDFPKMIRYTKRPDGALEAVVSDGGQKAQTFVFRREP